MPTLIEYAKHNGVETLMRALVIGYQVEQTPEEKLREYYDKANYGSGDYWDGVYIGIKQTLNILGITIEGINKEETE